MRRIAGVVALAFAAGSLAGCAGQSDVSDRSYRGFPEHVSESERGAGGLETASVCRVGSAMPDHYTYPDSEVLVNLDGYRDPAARHQAETAYVGVRMGGSVVHGR